MPMKTLKWSFLIGTAAIALSLLVSGSWILTESALQATSGEAFCSVCHTMKPFAESYAEDVHGGNNPRGLRTACADCHLPHEGQAKYLLAKLETGLADVWGELVAVIKEPDWIANLEQRKTYVYDSGCLSCHSGLQAARDQTETAAFGHQTYFKSDGAMACVTCHANVGHKDLLARLSADSAPPGTTASESATTQEAER